MRWSKHPASQGPFLPVQVQKLQLEKEDFIKQAASLRAELDKQSQLQEWQGMVCDACKQEPVTS